jgi:hypothetical protein
MRATNAHFEEVNFMLTCQLLNLGLSFEEIVLLRTVVWGIENVTYWQPYR